MEGSYTGEINDLRSNILGGWSFSGSTGAGLGPDVSFEAEYTPKTWSNPFKEGLISTGAFLGIGIEGSPVTGVDIQGSANYTPVVIPIFKFYSDDK